jgi:hypothetical protein
MPNNMGNQKFESVNEKEKGEVPDAPAFLSRRPWDEKKRLPCERKDQKEPAMLDAM